MDLPLLREQEGIFVLYNLHKMNEVYLYKYTKSNKYAKSPLASTRTSTRGGVFVWKKEICWHSGYRRPVRLVPYRVGEDLQASIPAGWCEKCGTEVYEFGRVCCEQCERWEENEETYAS